MTYSKIRGKSVSTKGHKKNRHGPISFDFCFLVSTFAFLVSIFVFLVSFCYSMRRSICRSFGSHRKKGPSQASGGKGTLQSRASGLRSTTQGNSIQTKNIRLPQQSTLICSSNYNNLEMFRNL